MPSKPEPSIVGFSESLDPLWVDLTGGDRWDGYTFRMHFASNGELTGLDVHRSGGAAELTATLLQRVPLGALERRARRHLRETFEPVIDGLLNPDSGARPQLQDILKKEVPIRQDSHDRAVMFARLAVRYIDTLDHPDQVKILADEFNYDESSIPKMIGRARNEYRFLTSTPKGRSGGWVTPEAYALLTRHVIEKKWVKLSDSQRAEEMARSAANKSQAEEALARYVSGDITHEEWELATFGQNITRDESGNVRLNVDAWGDDDAPEIGLA